MVVSGGWWVVMRWCGGWWMVLGGVAVRGGGAVTLAALDRAAKQHIRKTAEGLGESIHHLNC